MDHKIRRISLWYFNHKLEFFLRFQKQIWDCETALQKNWDQETKKPKIFDKHFSPYLSFLFPPPFPLSPPPPQKHMYVTIGCSGSAIQASRKSEETAHLQQLKEVTKYLFGIPERSMSSAFPTNGITTTFSSSGRPALKKFSEIYKTHSCGW